MFEPGTCKPLEPDTAKPTKRSWNPKLARQRQPRPQLATFISPSSSHFTFRYPNTGSTESAEAASKLFHQSFPAEINGVLSVSGFQPTSRKRHGAFPDMTLKSSMDMLTM